MILVFIIYSLRFLVIKMAALQSNNEQKNMELPIDLNRLKVKELKSLCKKYNIKKYSKLKKQELIEKITNYLNTIENEKLYDQLLEREEIQDEEFEKIIENFQSWISSNNLKLTKECNNGFDFEELDIREVRSLFIYYDFTKSYRREDKLIPIPKNKVEEFLEFFYDKFDIEWFLFNNDEEEDFFKFDSINESDFKKYLEK